MQTGTNIPIYVLEAKDSKTNLKNSFHQVRDYAVKPNIPIAMISNENEVLAKYVPNGKPLFIDDSPVERILSEDKVLKFIRNKTNSISTRALTPGKNLDKFFTKVNNLFRSTGVTVGIPRYSVFADVMFLKLIHDKEFQGYQDSETSWDIIKNQDPRSIINYVRATTMPALDKSYGGGVFSESFGLDNGEILLELMDLMSDINFKDDASTAGEVFLRFLHSHIGDATDFAEYFTPPILVEALIGITEPVIRERFYVPFCGTGGITTAILLPIRNIIPQTTANLNKWRKDTVFGRDIAVSAKIAKQMQILHGDGHNIIFREDSLSRKIRNETSGKFDCVVTNIPFGLTFDEKRDHYWIPTKNGSMLSIMNCFDSINLDAENGRIALICEDDLLEQEGQFVILRKELLKRADLHSVISLPEGTFNRYTATQSNILYFTNVGKPVGRGDYHYFSIDDVKNLKEDLKLFVENK